MGNREDLLAGARKVIFERGVAKATAREIAGAAGVSLAAIGYHFGSKEQLITEALTQSLGTGIGDRMDAVLQETASMPLLDAFAAVWNDIPAAFEANREALIASLENVVRMLRSPDESREFATAMSEAHTDTAEKLRETRPELDDAQADAVAKLYFALAQSLGIVWLVNPNALPTGDELARAVATLASR